MNPPIPLGYSSPIRMAGFTAENIFLVDVIKASHDSLITVSPVYPLMRLDQP